MVVSEGSYFKFCSFYISYNGIRLVHFASQQARHSSRVLLVSVSVLELPLTIKSQLNTLNSPEARMFVFLCGTALNCKLGWVDPDFDP